MRELTKAEEQVMQILWRLKKGFVNDILNEFPEPKPAYNTVSTIVRILKKKEVVGYKAYGKTHQYFPLVSKKEYTKGFFGSLMSNYFSDSYSVLASFLTNDKNISVKEMEDIKEMMEEEIKKQKSGNHE